ncbi:MAG: hypothetical protein O7G30_09615, partial [Proteobacteria bacterium]|nr:hypothetical protein [Pseudomonadota bacterium]
LAEVAPTAQRMTRNPLHDVAIVGAFNTRQATVLPRTPEALRRSLEGLKQFASGRIPLPSFGESR